MVYINLQARVGVLFYPPDSYTPTYAAKRNPIIFIIIVGIHLLLIVAVFNSRMKQRELHLVELALPMIQLSPEKLESNADSTKPLVNIGLHPAYLKIPPANLDNIQFDVETADLSAAEFAAPYELPSKKGNLYKDVFHPELRKKLQNLPKLIKHKPKIQHIDVGVTLEDIGNGKCIYGDALHKTGYIVKCGPDQGEQMMKNVEEALADPLGLK